jgi:hypothetical protein
MTESSSFGPFTVTQSVCMSAGTDSYKYCGDLYPDFLETAFHYRASVRGTFVLSVHRHFSHCGGVGHVL